MSSGRFRPLPTRTLDRKSRGVRLPPVQAAGALRMWFKASFGMRVRNMSSVYGGLDTAKAWPCLEAFQS